MSEGTMQRRAQRDDLSDRTDRGERCAPTDRGERRVRRAARAGGVNRALAAAAALPVLLFAAACSSDSGSDDSAGSGGTARADSGGSSASGPSASATPTVQAAAFQALPKACATLSAKTLTELVPKAKAKQGTSTDPADRASCSWSSLDNNGVKGSQFRWLNVSLLRFESDATRGAGDRLAQEYYAKQVKDAQSVAGAKGTTSQAVAGTGDQATVVRYDLKKKEGAFKQQTVVARVENVVVTVDYNGAGLAGDKTPAADTLVKGAEKAAKEAVASVRAANGEGDGGASSGGSSGQPSASASPSKSSKASSAPSASPSVSPSASPAKAAAAGASPSASAKS
ncbi:DUF3558 domain-containing protein [Streptomyces galbus]|uniref:DUF3558 domain-containing protein n=2 Tax=Streptomyces galbus TaxID=33898 RepID=A0A4U5WW46_STRGB|nr:DUF3558 domain-containing protein [Streptomyces galbus]TKT06699.1 DUF3558 domain-containing protein [Streptomyces galbus]